MIEKTIKYTDFNGVEREETFCFHISKAEMARREFTTEGTYTEYLKKVAKEKDSVKLYKIFEDFIALSYGVKSDDGKRFIKTDENGTPLFNKFKETPAYDELIIELFDAEKAAKFMRGVFPKDITDRVSEEDIKKAMQ